jgi:hypothetical protein
LQEGAQAMAAHELTPAHFSSLVCRLGLQNGRRSRDGFNRRPEGSLSDMAVALRHANRGCSRPTPVSPSNANRKLQRYRLGFRAQRYLSLNRCGECRAKNLDLMYQQRRQLSSATRNGATPSCSPPNFT